MASATPLHVPSHPVRFVTSASLFDGHDAAINIMLSLIDIERSNDRAVSKPNWHFGTLYLLIIVSYGLTLLLLCQNYMSLCVRIGKIDRLEPPLNA